MVDGGAKREFFESAKDSKNDVIVGANHVFAVQSDGAEAVDCRVLIVRDRRSFRRRNLITIQREWH